jgi:hypothetical protein
MRKRKRCGKIISFVFYLVSPLFRRKSASHEEGNEEERKENEEKEKMW